jgi:branched-chain amino acid transport system permease protein
MAATAQSRIVYDSLRDAAAAACIAALLALPLLGIRLSDSAQGGAPEYRLLWVLYAAAAVFFGRFAIGFGRGVAKDLAGQSFRHTDARPLDGRIKRGHDTWAAVRNTILLAAMIALAVALPLLPFADRNIIDRATLILIYVLLASGLNIVVGLAGLLDLGYVAFYAAGAYSYALLTQELGLSFWEAMPIAGLFAGAFGLLLGFPVLRLRGDYLAIVTLGFGQIVHTVLVNWTELTGGPNGIAGIVRPGFFGLSFAAVPAEGETSFADYFGIEFSPDHRIYFLYYLVLAVVLLAVLFVWRLKRLPLGRALEALREDETASIALGLNPTTVKLSAFALGAFIAGVAGSLFATRQGFISPESFTFIETAIILAIVVLGGMGSQAGIVFAAILLVGLPEWFRELEEYRMVAFGAAMVLIMLWRPSGLTTRRRPTVLLQSAQP